MLPPNRPCRDRHFIVDPSGLVTVELVLPNRSGRLLIFVPLSDSQEVVPKRPSRHVNSCSSADVGPGRIAVATVANASRRTVVIKSFIFCIANVSTRRYERFSLDAWNIHELCWALEAGCPVES